MDLGSNAAEGTERLKAERGRAEADDDERCREDAEGCLKRDERDAPGRPDA